MAILSSSDFTDFQAENTSVLQNVTFKDIDLATGKDITGRKTVSSSINNILTTPQGSIPGMVKFGFGYGLFEINDSVTHALMKKEIANTIQKWDNRLTVTNTNFTASENSINIDLELEVSDNSEYNAEVSIVGV